MIWNSSLLILPHVTQPTNQQFSIIRFTWERREERESRYLSLRESMRESLKGWGWGVGAWHAATQRKQNEVKAFHEGPCSAGSLSSGGKVLISKWSSLRISYPWWVVSYPDLIENVLLSDSLCGRQNIFYVSKLCAHWKSNLHSHNCPRWTWKRTEFIGLV